MVLPPKWYQFLVGTFASLGSFLFGYDLGIIAQVVASDSFKLTFAADSANEGLVVSLFTAGAFVGALVAGYIGDWFGRRGTILVGTILFVLGGGLQAGAQNIAYLQSGRFVTGIGTGILCMIVPLYQAELAHPTIRGRITSLQQFMLGVGALAASWIGYGCYNGFPATSTLQWRLPLALQVVPAAILGALIYLFPESPRWLLDHGHHDRGLQTLAQLHAHGNVDDPWVKAEYDEIQTQIQTEHLYAAKSWGELFRSKANARRIFLAVALQGSIQMTGVSAIQYYSPVIFEQIGISTGRTLLYQAINSIIALIAQFLCMLFIDHFGRRWPLILGNVGNGLTFVAGTILLAKFPPDSAGNPRSGQIGFIATTWIYNFSFSATCGPLSWIIPAEIFNTATRSRGVSLATATSFATNTMIGQVTPVAMERVKWRYYFLFVVCNFTNALFFWCLLPETAKVPLESMDSLFENSGWFAPRVKTQDWLGEMEVRKQRIAAKEGGVGEEEERIENIEEK